METIANSEWRVVLFSAAMAFLSTLIILPPGILLAWLLARFSWKGKSIVETIVTLPLVMPPVATGLILLKLLGRRGWVGAFVEEWFGTQIVFTWRAVIAAMAVMSFPLLVRGIRVALEEVNPRLEQVAQSLGASPTRCFLTITLPLARRGVAGGMILAFARALGEFGATVLVAGNIPGKTSTLSVSIYSHIHLGQDRSAVHLMIFSVALAFAAVWLSELFFRRKRR